MTLWRKRSLSLMQNLVGIKNKLRKQDLVLRKKLLKLERWGFSSKSECRCLLHVFAPFYFVLLADLILSKPSYYSYAWYYFSANQYSNITASCGIEGFDCSSWRRFEMSKSSSSVVGLGRLCWTPQSSAWMRLDKRSCFRELMWKKVI